MAMCPCRHIDGVQRFSIVWECYWMESWTSWRNWSKLGLLFPNSQCQETARCFRFLTSTVMSRPLPALNKCCLTEVCRVMPSVNIQGSEKRNFHQCTCKLELSARGFLKHPMGQWDRQPWKPNLIFRFLSSSAEKRRATGRTSMKPPTRPEISCLTSLSPGGENKSHGSGPNLISHLTDTSVQYDNHWETQSHLHAI